MCPAILELISDKSKIQKPYTKAVPHIVALRNVRRTVFLSHCRIAYGKRKNYLTSYLTGMKTSVVCPYLVMTMLKE